MLFGYTLENFPIKRYKSGNCSQPLFDSNLRGHEGDKTAVNREILDTLRNRPRAFGVLNNGVRMTVDGYERLYRVERASG